MTMYEALALTCPPLHTETTLPAQRTCGPETEYVLPSLLPALLTIPRSVALAGTFPPLPRCPPLHWLICDTNILSSNTTDEHT